MKRRKRLLALMLALTMAAGALPAALAAEEQPEESEILESQTEEPEISVGDETITKEELEEDEIVLPEEAAIQQEELETSKSASASTQEITLYAMDDVYAEYLTIPSDYAQSYDLSGHSYRIKSGDSITIEDGVVTPAYETWYKHQLPSGYWVGTQNATGVDGEVVVSEYVYGDTVVSLDNGASTITFHVLNYASEYSHGVMNAYIEETITDEMTDYEKAAKCCEFIGSYPYGTESSSATGMIVTGSGDCWASTDMLIYMLQQLGIKAQSRSASGVNGAGNGHINVLAILDGSYYVVDAGYDDEVPRGYSMQKFSTPFSYGKVADGTIQIVDFVNIDDVTELVIPEMIDGYTVSRIGDSAFKSEEFTSITIPDTVTKIGSLAFAYNGELTSVKLSASLETMEESAFAFCEKLPSITIPASVTEIKEGAFSYCDLLESITVEDGNTAYCSKDGVVFSADMTTLEIYPGGRLDLDYTVPEGVTTIAPWAAAGALRAYETDSKGMLVGSRATITLPKSLQTIGERAFYFAAFETVVFQEGITTIGSQSFESTDVWNVILPDTVTTIEEYAFFRADLDTITLSKNLTTIGEGAFAGDLKLETTVPASVTEIGDYAFLLDYGWFSISGSSETRDGGDGYVIFEKDCEPTFGKNVFSDVTLGVYRDSAMLAYAEENGIQYIIVDAVSTIFSDVPADQWYEQYVQYVYDNGLMTGTSATTFEPNGTVTRAQVAQILYNRAGKPTAPQTQVFSDVKPGAWYYNAVQWAQSQGIVSGVGNGKFDPNASVTREQFALMLYNAAGKPDASSSLSSFADSAKVSGWAKTAVTWAVSNGLISGISSGGRMYLQPQGTATRAQAATMLTKYDQKF